MQLIDLPPEILLTVLCHLNLADLCSVGAVCSVLYDLHRDQLLPGSHEIRVLWHAATGPRRARLELCPLASIVERFGGIRWLTIGQGVSAKVFDDYSILDTICRNLLELRSLVIQIEPGTGCDHVVEPPKKFKCLTWSKLCHLVLCGLPYGDDILIHYLPYMPKLTFLAFLQMKHIQTPILLRRSVKHLSYLGVDLPLHDTQLTSIIDICEDLKHLELFDTSNLCSRVLQSVRRALQPQLQSISFCNGPSTIDLLTALQTFGDWHGLLEVNLKGSQWIQDSMAQEFFSRQNIKVTLPCGYESLEAYHSAKRRESLNAMWAARRRRADARQAWYELATIGIKDEQDLDGSRFGWRLPKYISREQYTYQDPGNMFPPDDSDTDSMI